MIFGRKSAIVLKTNLTINTPIYNNKFLKTKIKSYSHKVEIFMIKKMPKAASNCTYFTVILIDFVLEKGENYYQQVF